jgi:hypothetical protein
MIVVVSYWYQFGQSCDAANMVAMPMRRDVVIDLIQVSHVARHSRYPTSIAIARKT